MKRLIIGILAYLFFVVVKAQTENPYIVLTPYVEENTATPQADKVLYNRLKCILSNNGVSSENGLMTPFIITASPIEVNRETTASVPPHTVVELSLTFYIGNGEDGTLFSSSEMSLRGVGDSTDKAYAAAYRNIKIANPQLCDAINKAKDRIAEYYSQVGPQLLKQAEAAVSAANYSEAYAILLRIPSACPQYEQAQQKLIEYISVENDARNGDIITHARAAWSSNPNEIGATEAVQLLAQMSNSSDTKRKEADALMKEMSKRIQSVSDVRFAEQVRRSEASHD